MLAVVVFVLELSWLVRVAGKANGGSLTAVFIPGNGESLRNMHGVYNDGELSVATKASYARYMYELARCAPSSSIASMVVDELAAVVVELEAEASESRATSFCFSPPQPYEEVLESFDNVKGMEAQGLGALMIYLCVTTRGEYWGTAIRTDPDIPLRPQYVAAQQGVWQGEGETARVAKVRIYEIDGLPQIELLLGALDMGGGTKNGCLFHFDSADLRSLKSQQQSVEPEVELDDTRLLSPLLIREAVKYLHAMQATAGSALLFNQFDATKAELVATIGANPKELRRIVSSAAAQQRVAGRISLAIVVAVESAQQHSYEVGQMSCWYNCDAPVLQAKRAQQLAQDEHAAVRVENEALRQRLEDAAARQSQLVAAQAQQHKAELVALAQQHKAELAALALQYEAELVARVAQREGLKSEI